MVDDKVSKATQEAFRTEVRASRDKRAAVRAKIDKGQWTRADVDDEVRGNAFLMKKLASRGQEGLQGLTNDLQPIAFMTEGAAVRRAVAKVVVDTDTYYKEGSGFLVSPRVLITNQHVVRDEAAAHQTVVIFDYELDEFGRPRPASRFRLDPTRLKRFSPEVGGLDYALIALGDPIDGDATIADLGYCPISNSADRHLIGMSVNIIQHPGGGHKQISVRNNALTFRTPRTLLYESDTDVGSSGSPVFNDDWDVVALHHYGEPFAERFDAAGNPLPLNVNEGIRISSIYNDLAGQGQASAAHERELLEEVLLLATTQSRSPRLPQLERRPSQPSGESVTARKETLMPLEDDAHELKLSIPLGASPVKVSVRVGGATAAITTGRAVPQLKGPAQLLTSSEGKRLDRDYSNRNGFNITFIEGVPVDLIRLVASVSNRVAPLADGTTFGELRYQNFSVIMDNRRDLALMTATNIDGDSYLRVDRKTGRAIEGEGETWYKDRRISDEYYLDQSFYSAWSHKFDRGHLTRRNDPTWGATEEEAERANADTFHFTNCTPQHFRFNQSAEFWQGIERYVLEQGVLKPGHAKHLTVLQGPVLDDRDDPWADHVQVPAQFWKIVIWNGANGPRAVGMLANQSDLFGEDRTFIRRPEETQPVDVRQFHTPISQIAKLTRLELGDLRGIDTFNRGLPRAGEAAVRITKWSDLNI